MDMKYYAVTLHAMLCLLDEIKEEGRHQDLAQLLKIIGMERGKMYHV